MTSFTDVDRRLVLRYADPDKRTFNFQKIRTNATAEALHGLASAVSSLQSVNLSMVTTVLTRHLMF